MIILQTRAMGRWTVELAEGYATFRGSPQVEDHTAAQALPRVWAGRGLGLLESELPSFVAALAEVMKTHPYWIARGNPRDKTVEAETAASWTLPWRDEDDGFVYVAGPVGRSNGDVGYRPATVFTAALVDLRGLRIRLAAYVKNSVC